MHGGETDRLASGLNHMSATTWRRLNHWRDHLWARSRMSAYVEGELSPRQRRRLSAHEARCPDCARVVATLNALLTSLPSLRLPPAASFELAERTAERVRARIGEWS
jgi:anti-sigma factor RsiW